MGACCEETLKYTHRCSEDFVRPVGVQVDHSSFPSGWSALPHRCFQDRYRFTHCTFFLNLNPWSALSLIHSWGMFSELCKNIENICERSHYKFPLTTTINLTTILQPQLILQPSVVVRCDWCWGLIAKGNPRDYCPVHWPSWELCERSQYKCTSKL